MASFVPMLSRAPLRVDFGKERMATKPSKMTCAKLNAIHMEGIVWRKLKFVFGLFEEFPAWITGESISSSLMLL